MREGRGSKAKPFEVDQTTTCEVFTREILGMYIRSKVSNPRTEYYMP